VGQGQAVGSDCNSSTTAGGGTCLSGCCCHYVTSPEGAQVCQACLACSDTSNKDPAFAPGPCSDGGAVPDDAGAVAFFDAGLPTSTPTTSTTPAPASTGCAFATVDARESGASIALLLGAVVLAGIRARRRTT
jgi:hypothetical protein